MTGLNQQSAAFAQGPLTLEDDLAVRLALATAADTCKGMFFNGVLDTMDRLLGEDAREKCRAAGGEKKYIDFFNYPIAQFLRISFAAAALLDGHEDADAAFFRLGNQAIADFLGSSVGKTLLTLVGKEPGRLLAASPTAYKTVVSYGERTCLQRGQHKWVLQVRRDFMPPPYHEGVLTAVLKSLGVQEVQVHGRALGVLDTDYEITLSQAGGGKP